MYYVVGPFCSRRDLLSTSVDSGSWIDAGWLSGKSSLGDEAMCLDVRGNDGGVLDCDIDRSAAFPVRYWQG